MGFQPSRGWPAIEMLRILFSHQRSSYHHPPPLGTWSPTLAGSHGTNTHDEQPLAWWYESMHDGQNIQGPSKRSRWAVAGGGTEIRGRPGAGGRRRVRRYQRYEQYEKQESDFVEGVVETPVEPAETAEATVPPDDEEKR